MKRWRVPPRKVSVPWEKNQQNCHIPIIQKKLTPERSWNTEWDPYEYFWYCETKNFHRKTWHTTIMPQSLRDPRLEKHWGAPPQNVSVLWEKKMAMTWYSYYPKNSWYQNISETQNGSPKYNFGTVRQKFASENRDLPLHAQKFSIPKINETIKCSPAKSFGTVTEKGFRQIRDTPIIRKEVDTWPFLKHRRVPLK